MTTSMNQKYNNILDNMTKAQLIAVIAELHDTVGEWEDGWGFTDADGKKLMTIGRACCHRNFVNGKAVIKLADIELVDTNPILNTIHVTSKEINSI